MSESGSEAKKKPFVLPPTGGPITGLRPFGERARRFIRRHPVDDARLNFLVGSIRSAKTKTTNAKLCVWLRSGWWPGGVGMITGKTKQSAKNNILNDVQSFVGDANFQYNQQSGELFIYRRPFMVYGAGDEGAHAKIKGSTVGIWLGDELTLYPKSFFDMAVSRLSLPESRMWGTTNPADPFHYLKSEYIDNEKLRAAGYVWSDNYTMDDNPNIDDKDKDFLKRSFTGVFYQRNILGLWVIAEGAIYRDVIADDIFYDHANGRPAGLERRNNHVEHWVAIDFGTVNPMVYLDIYDDGTTVWVDREYYWDSRSMMRQKTDSEYAADLMDFMNGNDPLVFGEQKKQVDQREWAGVILDPSAASFRAELTQKGIFVTSADNEVLEGIRKVSTMLNRKKLRIHRRCVNLIREMNAYAWDTKRADNGREQPIKAHDHAPDACRYFVNTRIPSWRLAA